MQTQTPFGPAATGPAKVLQFPPAQPKRLLLPREHGSWGMWLLPGITGAVVGLASSGAHLGVALVWFFVAAASAFLIYQPVEALSGRSILKARSPREQHILLFWIASLAALAAVGVFELVRMERSLVLIFAIVALGSFALHALLGLGRSVRSLRQIIAALSLTSTSAAAYYVVTGKLDRTACILWASSWIFAAAQIEYVQLRIWTAAAKSKSDKLKAGWEVYLMHFATLSAAIAAAAAHLVPAFLAVAFLPCVLRLGFWALSAPKKLDVFSLGFSELFQSVLFNSLLTAAFLWPRLP